MACRYLKDGGRADALERLGSNSSMYSPSAIPNSSTLNWRTRLPRRNWIVPGSSNSPHLEVVPVISDIIPPGVSREPGGTGA
ncbi:hypothetical protein GOBAR_AA37721 [Gossypium barbadense]|uniref:Uncharacterized protein n=1 Tax=Gossypium barbadense TaxID=3634 RepID=A0A2P5VVX1_GOSBA|nr:hypothetical protein GOBAR_AA37721 [Gossypium barbadense]